MSAEDYRAVAETAQKRRTASIPSQFSLSDELISLLGKDLTTAPRESGLFSSLDLEIVEAEATVILEKIRSRAWTSLQVTEAFCKSAAVAHQLTNCLTEILFEEALEHAKKLDEYLVSTGQIIGPLHGLPISLKDCFITPPHPSSIGMCFYANESTRPEEETLLVRMLRELGAIPYVKTNVPVGMMMMTTENNVWGECINPHHRQLTPGGSSGGEAALLAMYGSPLGIGTDIGGSIRIPAAFCYEYGLKPSSGRFPQYGGRSGIPGQEFVLAVNGPMSRSLESLKLYSAAVLSPMPAASPWTKDPKTIPLPWRMTSQIQPPGRKLRLAFVGNDDGIVTVHPPIQRALETTRKAVQAAGHEIVDWLPIGHVEILKLLMDCFAGFGAPAMIPKLRVHDEPIFAAMKFYEDTFDAAADSSSTLNTNQLREMCIARWKLSKEYVDRWQATAIPLEGKQPIDGIVMATHPSAAVRKDFVNSGINNSYVGYTGWVNTLDLPSCVFPVLKASASLDPARKDFKPLNELDANIQQDYDPQFYDGAPVGLQLIGERLAEEKVLEVVGVIRDSLTAMDGVKR